MKQFQTSPPDFKAAYLRTADKIGRTRDYYLQIADKRRCEDSSSEHAFRRCAADMSYILDRMEFILSDADIHELQVKRRQSSNQHKRKLRCQRVHVR